MVIQPLKEGPATVWIGRGDLKPVMKDKCCMSPLNGSLEQSSPQSQDDGRAGGRGCTPWGQLRFYKVKGPGDHVLEDAQRGAGARHEAVRLGSGG